MDPNHRTAGKIAKLPDLSTRESNHTHTNPEASEGEVARERAEKRGQNQTQTQRDPTQRRKRRGQEEPERVLKRLIERPTGVLEHQGEYLFFFRPTPLWLLPGRRTLLCDERIKQMHILYPTLGSRKWSADHYAVRSLVRP